MEKLSKLAVRRLTKLADYMDSLPASVNNHFDMSTIGPDSVEDFTRRGLMSCGAAACALGWAATMPSFRRAGWTHGWGDEELFFDIDESARRELFYRPQWVKTPKQWAKHARKFIRENS